MNGAATSSEKSEGVDSAVFQTVSYLENSPTEVFTMKKGSPVAAGQMSRGCPPFILQSLK